MLRNLASKHGIYEIGQQGQTVLLYVTEIPASPVLNLSAALRGRVAISEMGRKHIKVKMLPNQSPLECLKEIFDNI